MSANSTIQAPAAFVPRYALAFGEDGAVATGVDGDNPLPIETRMTAARSAPLTGSFSASGVAGPFVPDLGRPIWITLTGSWTGMVTVKRSTDGGASKIPLTLAGAAWASFTANANEAVGEESVDAAAWYLDVTLASGTLGYEVRQ